MISKMDPKYPPTNEQLKRKQNPKGGGVINQGWGLTYISFLQGGFYYIRFLLHPIFIISDFYYMRKCRKSQIVPAFL